MRDSSARSAEVFRSPQRVTITIPYATYQQLLERSDRQGRSMSNLAAYLLESALLGQRALHGEEHPQQIGA
ncbi:MAG: hypothetical protein ER33_01280 [Cyanobium sp. CACIAM 14]|nr:MAG: hypothetical protein ER33_01280 [Cyanobium sp. CACIAM 14]